MTGAQAGHKGPSAERTLTGRRRLHPVQISWLAGSVTRQCGHNGRPCSSRIATCWTAPHRAHSWKRDLATQLRHDHCPPIRRCRPMTRPHPGHGGRTILVAPASQSSLISLSTDGTGAQAPAPVSSPGWSCSAQASGRRCPAPAAAAVIAADTSAAGSAGSMAATTFITISAGSWPPPGGHCAHRGCSSRSRDATLRVFPQTAQGRRTGPQTLQYQSCPRRCMVRRSLPHPVQAGGDTARAPALRSAISSSPTARGAGDRPSVRTDGRSASA